MKPSPIPAGHPSLKTRTASIGTLANLAHDPYQAPHVRLWHRQVLDLSLSSLASSVRSVSSAK